MSYDESYRRIEHLLELRINILCEIELAEDTPIVQRLWKIELKNIYAELKELGWENQYKR
jgi:hypothetical protein